MNEAEISQLKGEALMRIFQKEIHPWAIGGTSGPFVAIDQKGEIVVLLEEGQEAPEVQFWEYSVQMISVMYFLQEYAPHFETTENRESVYCTINGAQALGADYFEAGMRAYLLYLARRKEKQTK